MIMNNNRLIQTVGIAAIVLVAAAALGLVAYRVGQRHNDTTADPAPSATTPTRNASTTGTTAAGTAKPIPKASGTPLDGDSPVPGAATPAPTLEDTATAEPTRTPLPPGRKGTPRGAKSSLPTKIDLKDADDVASMFVLNAELWDTKIDNRPNDSSTRAAVYATPKFKKAMLSGQPVAAPGADWDNLSRRHGYTTASVRLGGVGEPAPDTNTTAYRAVSVTKQTEHGDHGWTQAGPDQGNLYFITLHRTNPHHPWGVDNYQLQ